jgi:hypothetical protein
MQATMPYRRFQPETTWYALLEVLSEADHRSAESKYPRLESNQQPPD